ncbi:MAG: tryptophan synthase subunit alpha [Deltaproteobacteria bacterium]|nr:tryptophan synthase subunit alpha [Deltaproteobacteria bacterium]
MGRIHDHFEKLRARGEKALIPFLTAGDPDLETTEALVVAMAEAGADVIELGVPFSDPTAEGPTIQRSSGRALAQGTSLRTILRLVDRLRPRIEQPLVLMGYANPVHAMGGPAFAKAASEVGVDGIIIPDLTPEDGKPWLDPCREAGIDPILLASPTTRPERLEMLVRETRGFLYYVSLQGVTGARRALSQGIEQKVKRAQALGDVPVCVGFGVATPEHAAAIGAYADGVVVGSAIVDLIEAADSRSAAIENVATFIAELKKPLRG